MRRIDEGESISNLMAYFYKVASYVFMELLKRAELLVWLKTKCRIKPSLIRWRRRRVREFDVLTTVSKNYRLRVAL